MRLLKWLSLGAAVWIIYWALAAWGLRSGLEAWFTEQQRQGWQAEYAALDTSGFPLRHATRIRQPLLADPGTGAAWSADWVEFDSPALWPGAQRLRFPATPQHFSFYDQSRRLVAREMQAQMQLAPGLALTLEHLELTAGPWQLLQEADLLWQAEDLNLVMRRYDQSDRYLLQAAAQGFAPGGVFRRMGQLDEALPARFDTLELQADVTFDTAWDRRAIELRRPQPRLIDLQLADAQWGEMRFKATGALQVDEQGRLSGELALQVKNWRSILDVAERSSLLPPSSRMAVERVLNLFARDSGQGDKLDTRLRIQDGQVWIGPLPVGTAPRLVLR